MALFLNRCDISMIVDRKRSYLLASEPRAAREKSKIMQIKTSAHACSQSTTAIPTQKKETARSLHDCKPVLHISINVLTSWSLLPRKNNNKGGFLALLLNEIDYTVKSFG